MLGTSIINISNSWLSRKQSIKRESIGFDQASSFGVLYSYPDRAKQSAIYELLEELEKDEKDALPLPVLDKISFESGNPNVAVGDHQLSLLGKWKNEKVLEFCSKKFDYLLCLDDEPGPLIQNILLKSMALCRIGIHSDQYGKLYEMMIKPAESNDISYKMMDIYRYLRQLR